MTLRSSHPARTIRGALRRRPALFVWFVAIICACSLAGVAALARLPHAAAAAAERLRLFSSQSVFNASLPASLPLAGDSARLVSAFNEQIKKYGGHVVINTTEWSAPDYVVGPHVPTVAMRGESSICPRPEGVDPDFKAQIEAVPVPSNAVPAAGSDKEMIIWQPSSGHLWELWRALKESHQWTACWGGEITDADTSDGIFPAPYGAGASGLSILGGQIHLEDLKHGAIHHALEVLIPDTASSYVWPADKTDGTSDDSEAIPEGTRFRLSPKVKLSSLKLSPAALEIATAIQQYGLIVGDTGGAVALQAQDPSSVGDRGKDGPYRKLLGSDPDDVLDDVPWSKLEVVNPSYEG